MNHPETRDRLDDYVDGLLSAPERREVERHLAECADCRREVESIRDLLADADALPREIAPARDLWPEIAARIAQRKILTADFTPRWSARTLAAAAILLVALSSTITALVLQPRWIEPVASVSQKARPVTTAFAAFEASEGDYVRAVAQLTDAVSRQRDRLDPKTVAVIEKNLRIIDDAIRESRDALAADPNSIERVRIVAAMYEAKIGLLRQVSDLSSGI